MTIILLYYNYNIIVEAKINGFAFLGLDRNLLEQIGFSIGFQLSLIKIIEELVGICKNEYKNVRHTRFPFPAAAVFNK